jgi:hypothetical protein
MGCWSWRFKTERADIASDEIFSPPVVRCRRDRILNVGSIRNSPQIADQNSDDSFQYCFDLYEDQIFQRSLSDTFEKLTPEFLKTGPESNAAYPWP